MDGLTMVNRLESWRGGPVAGACWGLSAQGRLNGRPGERDSGTLALASALARTVFG